MNKKTRLVLASLVAALVAAGCTAANSADLPGMAIGVGGKPARV